MSEALYIGRILQNFPPGRLPEAHTQMSGLGWSNFKIIHPLISLL